MSISNDQINRSQFDVPLTEIEHEEVPTVDYQSDLNTVVKTMQESRHGALAVTKGNTAIGLISERDLIQKIDYLEENCFDRPVSELMTPGPFSLPETSLVSDAMKLIVRRGFRHVPITNEEGEYKWMLSIKDLLGFLIKFFPDHVTRFGTIKEWGFQTVDDYTEAYTSQSNDSEMVTGNIFMAHLKRVSHTRPMILDHDASILDVIEAMRNRKRGSVLLTRYETELMGVITERDLLLKVFNKAVIDENLKASEFMTKNPDTLLRKHYLAHAINNMFQFKYRSTIIVDEDSFPLSVISLLELFKFVAFHFYSDELKLL